MILGKRCKKDWNYTLLFILSLINYLVKQWRQHERHHMVMKNSITVGWSHWHHSIVIKQMNANFINNRDFWQYRGNGIQVYIYDGFLFRCIIS